jgi:hypothetical protein
MADTPNLHTRASGLWHAYFAEFISSSLKDLLPKLVGIWRIRCTMLGVWGRR